MWNAVIPKIGGKNPYVYKKKKKEKPIELHLIKRSDLSQNINLLNCLLVFHLIVANVFSLDFLYKKVTITVLLWYNLNKRNKNF